jgi:hypothetical protein
MITLKLGELVAMQPPIKTLINLQMSVGTSLKLMRLLKKIDIELDVFEEQKLKIFSKYGEENNGEISVSKDSDKYPDFMAEMTTLLNEEVTLDGDKIKIKDFGPSFTINVNDLLALEKVIDFEEALEN